jgi:NAD-dependent SIR2 family protein deacetylase
MDRIDLLIDLVSALNRTRAGKYATGKVSDMVEAIGILKAAISECIGFLATETCDNCELSEAVKRRQKRFDNLNLSYCYNCGNEIVDSEEWWIDSKHEKVFCSQDCAREAQEKLETPPPYKDI